MLVHDHAYGNAGRVPALVAQHSQRIRAQISQREQEEVERLEAEYPDHTERLAQIDAARAAAQAVLARQTTKAEKKEAEAALKKLESQRARPAARVTERDERIAETRRRAEDDREEVIKVGEELTALYDNPDELLKHARVVSLDESVENEFNLNIPRYVDTFEPEPRVEVKEALEALRTIEDKVRTADQELEKLIKAIGYALQQTSKRPAHWQNRRVDEVAEVGSGLTLGKDVSGFKHVELPYLRVANVQDGHLDLTTIKTVKVRLDEVERYRLEAGDVLMAEGGDIDKLGRGTLWDGQIPNCLHQQDSGEGISIPSAPGTRTRANRRDSRSSESKVLKSHAAGESASAPQDLPHARPPHWQGARTPPQPRPDAQPMSEVGYVELPVIQWLSGQGSATPGDTGLGWTYRDEAAMEVFDRPLEDPLVERLLAKAIIAINPEVTTAAQACMAVSALRKAMAHPDKLTANRETLDLCVTGLRWKSCQASRQRRYASSSSTPPGST